MDANDLKFLDNTFDSVTSFFTLMYVPKNEHKNIFQELYRVLKKNGEFALWDAIMPRRGDDDRNIFVIRLKVKMDDKTIDTALSLLIDSDLIGTNNKKNKKQR